MLEADYTAPVSAQGEAAQAQFSVTDYGYVGDQQPYQIVLPAYPAPVWMQRFNNLGHALRECKTLCRMEGRPFRLVRWGQAVRTGCQHCGNHPTNRLPDVRIRSVAGVARGMDGRPRVAVPLADVFPDGAVEVWDKNGKKARMEGEQDFVVSQQRAFRGEHKDTIPDYFDAVRSAQFLASHTGKKTYVCTRAKCSDGKSWTAVSYVHPGGIKLSNPRPQGDDIRVTPMTPQMVRQAIAASQGATLLGQGA